MERGVLEKSRQGYTSDSIPPPAEHSPPIPASPRSSTAVQGSLPLERMATINVVGHHPVLGTGGIGNRSDSVRFRRQDADF